MPLHPDYPPAVTLCNTSGTGLQPAVLDIGTLADNLMFKGGYPPVLEIVISATATVVVYGALEIDQVSGALLNPVDVSNGGFTASDFYDLIARLRFYQIDVTANTGNVIVKADSETQLLRLTTNATQGM